MKLKNINTSKTTFSLLDLLGADENALSKAFAFLLANNKECYFEFLRFLGIPIKCTIKNYFQSEISIQKNRKEGITDIELFQDFRYHVIVECKIKKGKVIKQRTQYLNSFNKNASKRILCILTQERDTNKQIENDVIIKNTSWLEIIDLYNNKRFTQNPMVTEFLKFTVKNYKMKEIKEILIQDLSDQTELERFEKYCIYRRDQTFGTPIYFAPYFTRGSGRIEGITSLSKILGILTFKPADLGTFQSDLKGFSVDKSTHEKWIKGIKLGNDIQEMIYTYYFLDNPLKFNNPLLKDGGRQKGRGKNWIAANIPPNRCVSFSEFIKHIPELSVMG